MKGEECTPGIEGGAREWVFSFPPSFPQHKERRYSAELLCFQLRRCDSQPEGQPGCSPKGVRNQLQACQRGRQRMGWGGRESQ